ncbi:MAG: SIS domain-containing protein [Clostridia bacterium]|nr:SIS domain-containing protein [Clostridia bacterium]MBQ4085299.1 SIS domain-containing protein [Clostridia bacterium]
MSAIDTYFNNLKALIARTQESQAQAMEQAAQHIAECFRNGGMVYTFGTGHGHCLHWRFSIAPAVWPAFAPSWMKS